MKFFPIVCLLCFLSLYSFSQQNKSVILDSITKNPIPFARVYIPGNTAYQTSNSKGEIFLDSLWMQSDKLTVFCYGYNKKLIVKPSKEILLSQKVKVLNEITIKAKKQRYGFRKLGETNHPSHRKVNSDFGFNIFTATNGDLKSVWIPNEKSLKGYLEKVNVFILAMGQPTAYFRIHFYACSKFKIEPGEELTTQNIIANGTNGNEWVTVDVSSMRIPLSENGIFVGIEWFENENITEYSDTLTFKVNYMDSGMVTQKRVFNGNGCVIGREYDTYRNNKHKNWDFKNGTWRDIYISNESRFYKLDTLFKFSHTPTPDNLLISIPCINIDVKYVKQKNEKDFEEPKKRKLNRIEKVKEDNYTYPQTTINELFSSCYKAIEKNELIYVLKYLCVYKNDQFKDICESAEEWEGKLSVEDQKNCLAFIRDFQSGLKEENVSLVQGNEYLLTVNGKQISLLHENGKWKLHPYSSRIYRAEY
jgi:hypothetical protein